MLDGNNNVGKIEITYVLHALKLVLVLIILAN